MFESERDGEREGEFIIYEYLHELRAFVCVHVTLTLKEWGEKK